MGEVEQWTDESRGSCGPNVNIEDEQGKLSQCNIGGLYGNDLVCHGIFM